jgi:putative flippase GtrA
MPDPAPAAVDPSRVRKQALLYAAVGLANAIMGYALFIALFELLKHRLHYLIILTISNLAYMVLSYVTNKRIVFQSRRRWVGESFRFYGIFAICVGANYAVMWAMVEFFGLHALVAQALATCVSMTIGFLGHRLFTFRHS